MSCESCRFLQRERAAKGKVYMRCMRRTDEEGKPWPGYGRVIEVQAENRKAAPERPVWCIEEGWRDV